MQGSLEEYLCSGEYTTASTEDELYFGRVVAEP